MPELRLTLLLVGLVFLVALTWWELRRPHQARGSELPRPTPEALERTAERSEWDLPPLDLPRMSARDPEAQLPIVELEPAPLSAATPFEEDFAEDVDAPAAAAAPESPALAPDLGGMEGLLDELGANQISDPPISDITGVFHTDLQGDEPAAAAVPEALPIAAPAPPADIPMPDLAPMSVVVDWPAAAASQVLAVRLISSGEKFSGRAVRMALAAEGFVLGKFSIFHKPAADGRALLSIASLNKPGTFDTRSIDLQRYSGLNLFTVLPGPMPGPEAVDEMLICAQVLSQRLRGTLQDERGEPLTPARTAVMRSTAAAAPT